MATQQSLLSRADLPAILQTPIRDSIPEDVVKDVLSSSPFIPIPMVLNLRTISSPSLAPNKIFRSGRLSHLPPSVLAVLKSQHNITTIFDLRSRNERERDPSPEVEGIETIWIPSTRDIDSGVMGADSIEGQGKLFLKDIGPANFVVNDGEDGYIAMYSNFLLTHKNPYKAVFEKIRDGDGAVLFHCTAGKDRTGVLAAMIHALLDSPNEIIATDYWLTRVGIEPFRERLLQALLQQMGKKEGQSQDEFDVPGMEEMCGVRGPTILAFLKSMNERYGTIEEEGYTYPGVPGYLMEELGFSREDLESIRAKLGNTEA